MSTIFLFNIFLILYSLLISRNKTHHTSFIMQWAEIKKKEAELAKVDKGAVGITKFKSR